MSLQEFVNNLVDARLRSPTLPQAERDALSITQRHYADVIFDPAFSERNLQRRREMGTLFDDLTVEIARRNNPALAANIAQLETLTVTVEGKLNRPNLVMPSESLAEELAQAERERVDVEKRRDNELAAATQRQADRRKQLQEAHQHQLQAMERDRTLLQKQLETEQNTNEQEILRELELLDQKIHDLLETIARLELDVQERDAKIEELDAKIAKLEESIQLLTKAQKTCEELKERAKADEERMMDEASDLRNQAVTVETIISTIAVALDYEAACALLWPVGGAAAAAALKAMAETYRLQGRMMSQRLNNAASDCDKRAQQAHRRYEEADRKRIEHKTDQEKKMEESKAMKEEVKGERCAVAAQRAALASHVAQLSNLQTQKGEMRNKCQFTKSLDCVQRDQQQQVQHSRAVNAVNSAIATVSARRH